MGLNDALSSERLHIGFFGMRNAGKSSLVNAVTGQNLSLVSPILGTTTDPVKKAMELLPLGPVVIIDTPGLDDEGELGEMRVKRAYDALNKTDIAILVIDGTSPHSEKNKNLENELIGRKIPYIKAINKSDLIKKENTDDKNTLYVSAKTGAGIEELKNMLGEFAKGISHPKPIISDLISSSDTIILVTPIDESAPKGRLILPQQMVLRDILDQHAKAILCQTEELSGVIDSLKEPPRLVITDSQVFGKVAKILPENIPLTSFSIIMARYKGELSSLIDGFNALSSLENGDSVLISEGCTHHRQCNDIGTVKMPKWIKEYSGKDIHFEFTSGGDFPSDPSKFKVIIHCGGCMIGEAEMKRRQEIANEYGIPMVNYGVAIAGMNGILKRSLEVFKNI